MTDESPDNFTVLFQLLIERVTTLSVQVETMRGLLESHGVFSASEFDQHVADVRARAQLVEHPHESLTRTLTLEDYSGRIRRVLDVARAADAPPPEGAS